AAVVGHAVAVVVDARGVARVARRGEHGAFAQAGPAVADAGLEPTGTRADIERVDRAFVAGARRSIGAALGDRARAAGVRGHVARLGGARVAVVAVGVGVAAAGDRVVGAGLAGARVARARVAVVAVGRDGAALLDPTVAALAVEHVAEVRRARVA